MLFSVVLIAILLLGIGYLLYGRWVARLLQLDDSHPTPACEMNDGVDYVPAKASMLLGQHFSAIAAAGPIVGPILGGLWFGWLPAFIWIVVGSIFIGGVHDFTSLVASIRHKASSMGEIVRLYMSPRSQKVFLIFMWLALVYVIIAFTDITAQTFRTVARGEAFGPGVAVSSGLYLVLGVAMGILLKKTRMRLSVATAIFIPLVCLVIWMTTALPQGMSEKIAAVSVKQWEVILLGYCFVASLVPMWLLLQPRGYLGGWFLYLTIGVGLLGALFGGYTIQYPAVHLEGMKSVVNGKSLVPILFITVACAACSGFHGIVTGGTTSRQIYKETDTKPVGYGAMILEALVGVLALATVMMLPLDDPLLKSDPNFIYASGLAQYMGLIHVKFGLALSFALLAFSTFVYDTLDVSTRLARYILQEIIGWKSALGSVVATLVTLLLPLTFLMLTEEKGYLVAWPIFGTSNQLLASLTLLAVSVWLSKTGRKAIFTIIPMIFMMIMTLWSLILLVTPMAKRIITGAAGTPLKPDGVISGIIGSVLILLTIWLVIEAIQALVIRKSPQRV